MKIKNLKYKLLFLTLMAVLLVPSLGQTATFYDTTTIKLTFPFAATGTTKTATFRFNGQIKHWAIVTPNFTNSVTSTLTLADENGLTFFSSNAYNKNTSNLFDWDQLVNKTTTATITISGAAGGSGGTVTVYLKALGSYEVP